MVLDKGPAFVDFLESRRSGLLDGFVEAMQEAGGTIARNPAALALASTSAGEMYDDGVMSVRTGRPYVDQGYRRLAGRIGTVRASAGVHPQESIKAASIWFRVAVAGVMPFVTENPEALALMVTFVLGLENSITTRIRESSAAYTGFLLNQVHEAQVKERQRIARELHDHIGAGLAIAHRQLELHEIRRDNDQAKAEINLDKAVQSVQQTMWRLRSVTSELHLQEPLRSLEKSLLVYFETIDDADGVAVDLRVSGDEGWAPTAVRDESFIILREAVRNAVAHARCSQIVVQVNITPRELRGTVEDNGRGFVQETGRPAGDGVGMASMRERAELIGGIVSVTSEPGIGSSVELFVPY